VKQARKHIFSFLVFLFCNLFGFGQTPHEDHLKKTDSLISAEAFQEALRFVNTNIETLIASKNYYESTDYIYYLGKITSKIKSNQEGEAAVLKFSNRLYKETQDPKALRQLHLETGSFYEYLGKPQLAIEQNLKALEFTNKMPDKNGQLVGLIYNNIGVFYSNMGNIQKASQYHKKAIEAYTSYEKTDKEQYYITYNSLGAMMWYSSKIDSALFYYKEAEKVLSQLEKNPKNQYYRPATLNNNMAAVHSILGDIDASIDAMQLTVSYLNSYIKEDIAEVHKDAGKEFLFQAIENLGGIYKDMGNFQKAKDILYYAFEQKQKHFSPDSPEIAKGKILLGQIELALKNFDKAHAHLTDGISQIESTSNNDFWLADAHNYLASIYIERGDIETAKACFEKSECYYKTALGEYYDEIYLDFIVNASHFYAQNGYGDKALELSEKAHQYIIENQGKKTLLEYAQVVNLAEINYELGHYQTALNKSTEALTLLKDSTFAHTNSLGKLQITASKPEAILVKVKSELMLKNEKDTPFIKKKYEELLEAIAIIEQEKTLLTHDSGINILLANNTEVFEQTKKLALELYNTSQDKSYLDKLLSLHESMLYNRIRTRLNSQSSLSFADIPKAVSEKENTLKAKLNASIENAEDLNDFMKIQAEWNHFLLELKKNHPKYYTLKYASISQSLPDISSKITDSTTLIKYAFIDENLYAFVITNKDRNLVTLNNKLLKNTLDKFENVDDIHLYHDLYNVLWKPLETLVKTEKVVVIPDQILFNTSFETLSPIPVANAKELAKNCLLSKHNISYHYSLFLLDNKSKTIGYDKSFIAFTPEFDETMKEDYKLSILDSITMDNTYLKLLPQPFSKDLAKQYAKVFKGEFFANKNASKTVFLNEANEHKIIHIGTHAESNNISPELSRLIFAKHAPDDNNSLFTYEIYDQNLNSNLAILTACETGKPTYQAGEGMISLAHAFNYAGSESILTSLWEIDEQSSMLIVESFYNYLAQGLPKDEALKNAKLDYIANAEDRTLAPSYWAGLVLIGDSSAIDISASNNFDWLLFLLLIVAALSFVIIHSIRQKKKS